MLLISSAQAAPVLTSYVDSGQVEGMVAGFMGGLAFEQLTQATVRGQAYWDSYQIGIALAVTFILIGAIYQSIFSAKSRRKKVRRG